MTSLMPIDRLASSRRSGSRTWRFQNYSDALDLWNFKVTFSSTVIITTATITGNLVSSTLVAYGFARFRFPFQDTLFLVLLATMMLPFAVLLIPVYIGYNELGLVNTFGRSFCALFGNAFFIFLGRQFFIGIRKT